MLISIILGKSVARGLYDEPVNKPYRKLEVDDMPIIETLEKLDYNKLLEDYQTKLDKPLKPVVRRKNSVVKVPARLTCPKCSAHLIIFTLAIVTKDNISVKCVIAYLVKRIVF